MRPSCRSTRRVDSWATSRATAGGIRRSLLGLLVGVAAALGAALPAAAAPASVGSVPPEVTQYVSDGSLVVRLDELYGLDASGDNGIDFDDTTKPGPISRVWVWTAEVYSGEPTEHPTELTNNWVVPITIAEEPVGVATIWINPELEAPELAEFAPDAEAAVALAAVPEAAQLVRDDVSDSWFALQDGILTPLVPGRSGLETPTPLDDVALVMPVGPEPAETGEWQPGLTLAIAILVLLAIVIGVSLFVSSRRGKPAVGDDLSSPAP